MAMDVWVPLRNKDVEMVVFGDGGGFVRLYEIRINPLVSERRQKDTFAVLLVRGFRAGRQLTHLLPASPALSQVP